MAAAAEAGALIRLVTGDLKDSRSWNYKSVTALVTGAEGQIIRPRLRVLCAAPASLGLMHAKLIVADHTRGYLGSATSPAAASIRTSRLVSRWHPNRRGPSNASWTHSKHRRQ
jgi:hypothetical protein